MADSRPLGQSVASRSSVFFVSDVNTAADNAAFAMEEHGLTTEQVQALQKKIENAILDFYEAEVWNA